MAFGFGKKIPYEEYGRSSEKHGVLWWISRVVVCILVFGTTALLLWRVFTSGDPAELRILQPNQALADAYAAASADGRDLDVYYCDDMLTYTAEDGHRGYFFAQRVRFIDDANQVQFLLRYNNSTIRYLKEDYKLEEMPDRDDDLYDVTLYIAYDLTPEDSSDNGDVENPAAVKFVRIHPTSVRAKKKGLYNYRYFVFDGVDMTVKDTPVLAVFADIYYSGDVHYLENEGGTQPYSALSLYNYSFEKTPYELTKKEKQALEKWIESHSTSESARE